MSEENLELTRLGYEAFNRGDIDGFLDICDPNIEWQDIAAIDTAAVTGREAVRAFFETATAPWEEIRREPEEIIDLGGDHVLVLSHTTGRGKGSGIVVDARAESVHDQGRQTCALGRLSGSSRSPRSRRAVGVGDVGGERSRT